MQKIWKLWKAITVIADETNLPLLTAYCVKTENYSHEKSYVKDAYQHIGEASRPYLIDLCKKDISYVHEAIIVLAEMGADEELAEIRTLINNYDKYRVSYKEYLNEEIDRCQDQYARRDEIAAERKKRNEANEAAIKKLGEQLDKAMAAQESPQPMSFLEYEEIATIESGEQPLMKIIPSFVAVSPDGKTIAFPSAGKEGYELYLIGRDGKNKRALMENAVPIHQVYPIWSFDGNMISFLEVDPARGELSLCVVDSNGRNVKKVASDILLLATPCWSRDNKKLIFQRPGGEICSTDIGNLKTETLFSFESPVFNLSVSPDGNHVAFCSEEISQQAGMFPMGGCEVHVCIFDIRSGKIKEIPLYGGEPQNMMVVDMFLPEHASGEKIKWIDNNRLIAAASLVDIDKGTAECLNRPCGQAYTDAVLISTALSNDKKHLLFNKEGGLHVMDLSNYSVKKLSDKNAYIKWWDPASGEAIILELWDVGIGEEIIIGRAGLK